MAQFTVRVKSGDKTLREILCDFEFGGSVADFVAKHGAEVLLAFGTAEGCVWLQNNVARPMAAEKAADGSWKYGPEEVKAAVRTAKLGMKRGRTGPSLRESTLAGLRAAKIPQAQIDAIMAAFDAEQEKPQTTEEVVADRTEEPKTEEPTTK
jgi:hypothetical protein